MSTVEKGRGGLELPRLAVRRPITTCMVLLSVLLFGGIAFGRLKLAFLPTVDIPFISIQIPYPSSSPGQIEREVVKPVEEVLATLSGVKRMRSDASADQAQFQLEFDWGHEIDIVRMQVSEKMEQVRSELPTGIGEILIASFNTNDIPVVEARLSADGVDLSASYELLEARVQNRLRRVPGVARVDLDGVAPKEIYIELVLDDIKRHGVDIGDLIDRMFGTTSNLVLGEVSAGGMRYTARAVSELNSIADLEELVIDPRGLRLRDVARVRFEEPAIAYSRHLNRKDAVAVTVFKESTANTVEVVHRVMAVIHNDINTDPLLQGIDLFVFDDQAEQITSALNGLTRAGLLGALLAIVVLYLFFRRLGPTLIVSLSIPFSIVAAGGVMYFLGKTLNVLSMMGLMLGVGMLVDNAIVVLESIDRRRREDGDAKRAAEVGASQVWLAVSASTLTSLIVFLPLIIGSKSDLTTWLGEVGLTISLALVCSLFASLTLIPLVSSRFLRGPAAAPPKSLVRLERLYVAALRWTLRRNGWTALLLLLALAMGLLPLFTGMVETGMFSARVNDRYFLVYDFSGFTYKSAAKQAVEEVEAVLGPRLEDLGLSSMYSFFASNRAQTTLSLDDQQSLSAKQFKRLRGRIRELLPEIAGVDLRFNEDEDSGGGSTFFSVNFYGQDSALLTTLAEEAERRLETVAGVVDLSSSHRRGQQEIQVRIDRDKAARLGLTAEEVSQVFGFTLGGLRLPRFRAADREVETWLALRLEDRASLADLSALQFREVAGRPVTLGDIATFEVIEKPQQIRRENRKVRLRLAATYEGEDWQDTRQQIAALMDAFDLPSGYSWSWGARMLEQDTQNAQMGINFLLALALVYLVMASLFESLSQPLAILWSIPFALPGALWLLALTDSPFNLMAQIGLLILMGIVVNNGIVLLDHVNRLRQAGMGREEAILEAGRDRLRPILMTASTTIIGLLPLALGGSSVADLLYYPLALTVMGGLISSALLTLLVLPWISVRFEVVGGWMSGLWRHSNPSSPPATSAETVEELA